MPYLDAIRQFFFHPKTKKPAKIFRFFFAFINSPQTQIPADMLFGEELFFGMIFAYLFGIPKSKIRRCANEYF